MLFSGGLFRGVFRAVLVVVGAALIVGLLPGFSPGTASAAATSRASGLSVSSAGVAPVTQLRTAVRIAEVVGQFAPATESQPVSGRAIQLVIDVSGSMAGERLDQAKSAMLSAIDGLNDSDVVGLRSLWGSCASGGSLEVAPGVDNRDELRDAVLGLWIRGGTPTHGVLEAAAADFPADATDRTIVLVSDGESICQPIDPCVTAQEIAARQPTTFRVHGVGFNASAEGNAELECIAQVTGGKFLEATDSDSLREALELLTGQDPDGSGGSWGVRPEESLWGISNPASNATDPVSGDPVNSMTGNFTTELVDVALPVRGPGLGVDRAYNAQAVDELDGVFGAGWSSTLDMSVTEEPDGSVTVTQENGSQVTFDVAADGTYSAPEWVLAELEATGSGWVFTRRKQLVFELEATGDLSQVRDLNGESSVITRDSDGHVTSASSSGQTLQFTTDGGGRITSVTAPGDRTWQYGYEDGNLVSVTDPLGGVWGYVYDDQGRLTHDINPLGDTLVNVYDDQSRVVEQTNRDGAVLRWDYAEDSTTVIGNNGQLLVKEFTDGQMTAQTTGAGSDVASRSVFTYDPDTLGLTSTTDALGRTVAQVYDNRGSVTEQLFPDGTTVTFTYDELDNVTSVTDQAGVTSVFTYDTRGNLLTSTVPTAAGDSVSTVEYSDPDHPGDVTATVDPEGRRAALAYTEQGLVSGATDPLGRTTGFAYNAAGETDRVADADGRVTQVVRDNLGRVTGLIDPSGVTGTVSYDAAHRVIARADDDGNVTKFTYDKSGRQTSTTDPDGGTWTSTYLESGQLAAETDPLGRVTTYEYDPRGLPVRTVIPGDYESTVSYDAAGQMTTVTDAAGLDTTFGYDPLGRLVSVAYADNTPNVSYEYDQVGRTTSVTDGTGTSSYAYDPAGQLTAYANGAENALSYAYDRSGLLTELTYPNGSTVGYTYDQAAQLVQATDWRGQEFEFDYTESGGLETRRDPNGVTTTYAYDGNNQVTRSTISRGKTTLLQIGHQLDDRRLITEEKVTGTGTGATWSSPGTGGVTKYQYDTIGQLIAEATATTDTSYDHDIGGQLTSVTSEVGSTGHIHRSPTTRTASLAYGNGGQLTDLVVETATPRSGLFNRGSTTTQTAEYGYDERGARTSATVDGTQLAEYGYDQAGRLTSFAGTTGGTGLPTAEHTNTAVADLFAEYTVHGKHRRAVKTEAEYTYAANGLRASKTVNGQTTEFTYDPVTGLVAEGDTYYLNGPGGVLAQYDTTPPTTPRGFGIFKHTPVDASVLYLHADQVGSTRLLMDQRGNPAQSFKYTPYGQVAAFTDHSRSLWDHKTGHTNKPLTNLLYGAGYFDTESGLYYLINRYYDPKTAQFLTIDPALGVTGQPYAYAGNNPINLADPFGMWPGESLWNGVKDAVGSAVSAIGSGLSAVGNHVADNWRSYARGALIVGGIVAAGACIVATAGICGGVIATGASLFAMGAALSAADYALQDLKSHTPSGFLAAAAFGGITNLNPAGKAGSVSRLVPGGGLAAHEAAGGHALARHVGMVDVDLVARLSSQPGITGASSFASRAVAESSIAGLIDANAAGVSSWLAGSGGKLVLNGGTGGVTGRYVAQGSQSISNVTGVRAVLVRDPSSTVGYRIQTAFPTP